MKKIGVLATVLCVLLSFASCKSKKESSYKEAYEQAKERESAAPIEEDYEPVSKPKTEPTQSIREEKVTPISGEDDNIKAYAIVIGSFKNRTNAYSLKERMQNEGFKPILAENPQGMLRVILVSYDNSRDAEISRNDIRDRYYPSFQDAWVLKRQY